MKNKTAFELKAEGHLYIPPPWNYNPEDQIIHIPNDFSKLIAQVRGWGWIQKLPNAEKIQDANGRLMACAPELLEALEMMIDRYTHLGKGGLTEMRSEAIEKSLSAISKARGGF